VRWRPSVSVAPTVEGWALAFIACCLLASSFIQRVNLLVLVFALLVAVLFVGMVVARRNVRRLQAKRVPTVLAFAGTPFDVTIEVANRGTKDSFAATVEDGVDLPNQAVKDVLFPRVARGGTAKSKYILDVDRRGRFALGPLTLQTRFPFGLFVAKTTVDSLEEVVVFPRLGEMTEAWRRSTGRSSDSAKNLRRSIDRMQEEFHGLRDYREGDNLRHIHWLSTARRGQPIVKEFETLAARDVVLFVDPKPSDEHADLDERAEEALSFAATACVDLGVRIGALGGRIILAIAGPEPVVVQGQASPRLVEGSLRALGLAEYSGDEDWKDVLNQLGPNQCRSAQAWFIGTRPVDAIRREYGARFGFRAAADAVSVNVTAGEERPYFMAVKRNERPTTAPA
jgi:uncharacterized protein (DUF58 family)